MWGRADTEEAVRPQARAGAHQAAAGCSGAAEREVIPSSSSVSTRPLRSSAAQPMQRNDTQYRAAASIDQYGRPSAADAPAGAPIPVAGSGQAVPLIVEALAKLRSQSGIIDGEAVAC